MAAAVVIPGAGHILLKRPMRGLVLLYWMIVCGFLTNHLAGQHVSVIGRLSGGIAVWVLSVLEVYRLTKPGCDR